MNNEIRIKDIIKVLSLFFGLAVISLVLVYSKFEKEIDEAWKGKENKETIFDNEVFCEIIDLDNYKTTGDVDEFDKKQLVNEYIESGGKADTFTEKMEKYFRGE